MSGKVAITIEVDVDNLASYTDQYLAMAWHVAQANPADGFEDRTAGDIAMKVGWEIIRRWLRSVPPEIHHHQQHHYYWRQLIKLATYEHGGPPGTAEFHQGTWVAKTAGKPAEDGGSR